MNNQSQDKEASKETGWSEASPQDKTERLRFAIKNLELIQIGRQLSGIQSQIYQLKNHDHSNGKVVVPIDTSSGLGLTEMGQAGQLTRKNPLDD